MTRSTRLYPLFIAACLLTPLACGDDGQAEAGGESEAETEAVTSPVRPTRDYVAPEAPPTLLDFVHHPDRIHQPYMSGPVLSAQAEAAPLALVNQFRDLLALYQERMGIDNNFTLRVVDNRSGQLLELHELDEARDDEDARRLWEVSGELTGVEYDLPK